MLRQNQAKAFSMSIRYFINNKKHGNAVLFCRALNVGAVRPKPGHKKLFGKSFLELQKLLTE